MNDLFIEVTWRKMVPGKKIMGAEPLIHPTADLKGVKTKKSIEASLNEMNELEFFFLF